MSIFTKETFIIQVGKQELIFFYQTTWFLPKEKRCANFWFFMNINKYHKNVNGFIWRCINRKCLKLKIYVSIKKEHFLDFLFLQLFKKRE